MKFGERGLNFAVCAFFWLALQGFTIPAQAKPVVTFTSPCECIGNHGVSRWAAKTDLQEPPANGEIKKSLPHTYSRGQGREAKSINEPIELGLRISGTP